MNDSIARLTILTELKSRLTDGTLLSRADKHRSFIAAQKFFYRHRAASTVHLITPPKGMDSLRVIAQCVAYLDSTGSGNETAAHLKHDGRIDDDVLQL